MRKNIIYSTVSVDYIEHTSHYGDQIVNKKFLDIVNIMENENFMKFITTWGYFVIPICDIKYVSVTK